MFTKRMAAMLTLLAIFCIQAQAQDEKKFEAGGQITVIRVPVYSLTTAPGVFNFTEDRQSDWGFGGRFGYNFSRDVGVEAEGNFFTGDDDRNGGSKTQGLFGVKAGRRFDSFGIFAKARPGVVRFSQGDFEPRGGCIAVFPPPRGCFDGVSTTNFAFDLGGVAEIYPSSNTIVRFDVGDTMIRLGDRLVAADHANGPTVIPRPSETKHNLQVSVGVGFRF